MALLSPRSPLHLAPSGNAQVGRWPRLAWGQVRFGALARWLVTGVAFTVLGMVLLYVLRDLLSLPLPIASLATAELSTLLRFPVNDRWVFEHLGSSWTRLGQFHVAQAGSFSIFLLVVNGLALFGVHYLLAAAAATCCTAGWSMAMHFLWIWRAPPIGASGVSTRRRIPSGERGLGG